MAYQKTKLDWLPDDPVMPEHIEHIETQYDEAKKDLEEETSNPKIKVGVHVNATNNPPSLSDIFSSKLNTILGYIVNRLKAFTGQNDWTAEPPANLQDLRNHIDAANPHSGSEPADPNIVKTNKEATFTVPIVADNNQQYEKAQIRNVVISDRNPGADEGEDGDIWLIYKE